MESKRVFFVAHVDLDGFVYVVLCLGIVYLRIIPGLDSVVRMTPIFFRNRRHTAGPNFPAFVKMQDFTHSIY